MRITQRQLHNIIKEALSLKNSMIQMIERNDMSALEDLYDYIMQLQDGFIGSYDYTMTPDQQKDSKLVWYTNKAFKPVGYHNDWGLGYFRVIDSKLGNVGYIHVELTTTPTILLTPLDKDGQRLGQSMIPFMSRGSDRLTLNLSEDVETINSLVRYIIDAYGERQ